MIDMQPLTTIQSAAAAVLVLLALAVATAVLTVVVAPTLARRKAVALVLHYLVELVRVFRAPKPPTSSRETSH